MSSRLCISLAARPRRRYSGATVSAVTWPCQCSADPSALPITDTWINAQCQYTLLVRSFPRVSQELLQLYLFRPDPYSPIHIHTILKLFSNAKNLGRSVPEGYSRMSLPQGQWQYRNCQCSYIYMYSFINSHVSNRTMHNKIQYDIKVNVAIKTALIGIVKSMQMIKLHSSEVDVIALSMKL